MSKIKLKPTDRLFFGKYPYKINFDLEGVALIRIRGLDWTKEYCVTPKMSCHWMNDRLIDRKKLKLFLSVLEPFLTKEEGVKTRTERNRFSFYTTELSEIETLAKELKWCCSDAWGPSTKQELDYLLSNRRKVLRDKLPYEMYRFRVNLRESMPAASRLQFIAWADNYSEDTIKMSHSTRMWLAGNKRYCQAPFFYVTDEKLLTFASIFLSNHVNSVYEYIPRHTVI